MNTFNGGTSSQHLDGSYAIIKEVAKRYDVKHVYLELYYEIAFTVYKERTEMTDTYIISDYLKPSLNKIKYLLNASTKDYYFNSFILARRNWTKFFDADYVKNLIIKKGTEAYKNYEYTFVTSESEWYAGKGYVANNETIDNWNYFSDHAWNNIDINSVSKDWICTLDDIIEFCDKSDIALTLITAPMPDYLLAGLDNYDEYVGLVRKIIAGKNVKYYDFNLCKEYYWPSTSAMFKDTHHLNCYGAEMFSYLLADLVNGKILEKQLFYDSYTQKLANMKSTVFGVSYHDNTDENGEQVRECKIVSTGNEDMKYKVFLSLDNGESYLIQEFSDNSFFSIKQGIHGTITIMYKTVDAVDQIQSVYIDI